MANILVCPSVVQVRYWREVDGQMTEHKLFIAFSVDGSPVVSLRIGSQWSGWHGLWVPTDDGWHVLVHWAGRMNLLRYLWVCTRPGRSYMRISSRTLLLTQMQLADGDPRWVGRVHWL